MPDTNDWLMALVSGLGGAFTGAGAARGRRSAEAEVARKAALEAERERRNATTQAMQQEVSLRGIGYVPAEEMTPMRPSFGGTGAAEIAGSMAFDAGRRGPTRTEGGRSFTLDRTQTPQALARQELERRTAEKRDDRNFQRGEREASQRFTTQRDAATARAARERGMNQSQVMSAANIIASRFDADPIVRNAKDIAQSYQRVMSTRDDAAGDLSLIFAYMKMLDPGSVVREGEFANAQSAAGVPEQIRNSYNRALKGVRLTPSQRQQFRAQARELARGQRQLLQPVIERYSQRAAPLGVDPSLLFADPFSLWTDIGGGENAPPNNPNDY